MKTNKANSCFSVLLCAVLLSSGCGEKNKPEEPKPENPTIQLSTTVSIEMVKLPRPNEPVPAHFAEWFGKYEVTQAQWETVMGNNPSEFKAPNNPVERVSWNDCQEFLRKLNTLPVVKQSGLMFRLPTEEEWEHACRAGTTDDYCRLADGTEITKDTLGQVAWFDENSDDTTHPVGQKQPNAFGLYDMHGNVWEWTSTADGENRVQRGGSWDISAWWSKSSDRCRISPLGKSCNVGFRLCASSRAD